MRKSAEFAFAGFLQYTPIYIRSIYNKVYVKILGKWQFLHFCIIIESSSLQRPCWC